MSVWLSHHFHALAAAIKRLTRTPTGSLLSIAVIGIAFSLPAGIYVLLENLQSLSGQFSGAPQLSLFLKLDADSEAVAEIESRLKQHPDVGRFTFIPKGAALEQLKQSNDWGDVMDGLERNPLPDAFVLSTRNISPERLEALRTELVKLPQVEHAQLDSAWAKRLDALLKLGRAGVLMLAALLSFSLVAVAFNTIRLQIMTMRDEIEVSKLIGATRGFIRRPFLYFGAIQGAVGGAAAWLIISWGIHMADEQLKHLMNLYEVNFRLYHLSLEDSLSLLLLSALLGWIGAWLSVTYQLGRIEPR
ncbi:cell division protein FtsX [Nitrosospira sp. Nsp14]|jgi:cell division transport system permease protein|uniref:permease-like cell division protein FtsX n=1 Tax=Nitrosospira sp. Nsp14 TaxID=1855333 RepID=UPI0008F13912|nr:permease-like cell division protein FtsX [Nitrosospira sp. Nsp14]SFH38036.1 cell division protein FtsX [Nitrosospira sp. Nsp14]